jgi:hypothetical protein
MLVPNMPLTTISHRVMLATTSTRIIKYVSHPFLHPPDNPRGLPPSNPPSHHPDSYAIPWLLAGSSSYKYHANSAWFFTQPGSALGSLLSPDPFMS